MLNIKNHRWNLLVISFFVVVALKRAVLYIVRSSLLLAFLFGLFGKKNCLDVREDASLSYSDPSEQLVQFFIVPYSKLKVPWNDSCFFVVSCCIASKLKDFCGQVLKNSGHVNRSSRANALSIVSTTKKTVDSTDWKLKSSTRWTAFGFASALTCFSTASHSYEMKGCTDTIHTVAYSELHIAIGGCFRYL